jgi:hypothetical protein
MVSPLLCVHTILTHDYQALANTIVPANSFEVHVYTSVCWYRLLNNLAWSWYWVEPVFNLYEIEICLCGAILWIFKRTISSGSFNDLWINYCWFWLFQNPYKTNGFHERTIKEPVDSSLDDSLTVSYFWRTRVM